MKKYFIYDSSDSITDFTFFETLKEAEQRATVDWSRLTDYDKKQRDAYELCEVEVDEETWAKIKNDDVDDNGFVYSPLDYTSKIIKKFK